MKLVTMASSPYSLLSKILLVALVATLGWTTQQATAQSNSCADGTGLTLIAKFEVDAGGNFVFAEGTSGVVTISNVQKDGSNEPISADFSSTTGVVSVFVKASTNTKTDSYNPSVTSGSFDNSGLGNHAISNVSFCEGLPELEFCEYNIDLRFGDTFNIRDYVQPKTGNDPI
ncbi:MAG: hypothetical protein ACE5G0_10340, partial [Rhodothermales bacterium]